MECQGLCTFGNGGISVMRGLCGHDGSWALLAGYCKLLGGDHQTRKRQSTKKQLRNLVTRILGGSGGFCWQVG